MKVLEYCTLLQACEYLAFGWKPLSEEDELFCEEERWRPYLQYNSGPYEKVNPIHRKLDRAKARLILLFDKGLHCYSNGTTIQLPKIIRHEITKETNIQVMLGVILENDYSGGEQNPPYVVIQNFKCKFENEYIHNVTINFAELKKLHEVESAEVSDVYRLFIDDSLYLCCQKNNDKPIRVKDKPLIKSADNYLILKHVMDNPGIKLNQDNITTATKVTFAYEKGINNKLQSIFTKRPEVKVAFFDMNAQEIRFKGTVTNRDLEKENKKAPI